LFVYSLVSQHSSSFCAAAQFTGAFQRAVVPFLELQSYRTSSRRDKIHAWQHAIKRWLRVVVTVSYHRR